jgi:hypothetical protein
MKVMRLIPVFIIIILVGCDTKQLNGPVLDTHAVENANDVEITSIQDFAKIARQLEANIPREVLSGQIKANSFMSTHYSEKIAEILEPLKKVGLSARKQMLKDSELSNFNSKMLSNLSERELALLGMLHIIIKDREKTMNGNFKSDGYSIEMQASITACIRAALGADVAYELIKGNIVANTDNVLKAFSKLARRTLGWVGAAYAVYEFTKCIN